jgi:hypothetical protein
MSYQKHTWVSNEIIKKGQLNNIENGIYNEEQRALEQEELLQQAITNEVTRATNREGEIASTVTQLSSNVVKKTDLATNSSVGVVKPDGSTVTVDDDGTLHASGSSMTIDTELSDTSTNPVQNQAIVAGINNKHGNYYGTCDTAASTRVKAVTVSTDQDFKLAVGVRVIVKFTNTNTYSATASAPCQLNVNSTGAKNIYYNNSGTPTGTNTTAFGYANRIVSYVYDGTYWVWDGMGTESDTRDFRIGTSRSGASANILYFVYS